MALSRSARIKILLVIDSLFFLVELIVGYGVGSLALVADSFHMLNDVMSLLVALYAIKLTDQQSDHRYTYGWHRAEILAALINGVFLLALCFSIALEAIGRFFANPEVSNAQLVVIVGSWGLASNIVGLFLFHEHGHGHSHDHGHSHSASDGSRTPDVIDTTPQPILASSPLAVKRVSSPTRDRAESAVSLYGHPAATRASLVQVANDIAYEQARSPSPTRRHRRSSSRPSLSTDEPTPNSEEPRRSLPHVEDVDESDDNIDAGGHVVQETSPLLEDFHPETNGGPSSHDDHSHEGSHSHGHSHGSMNMRGVLLHVLGDALGNVGVIATGLIIWLTEWKFKYYCDPVISLVITVIIFSSALPLVRSASFILLQGVPQSISLDEVREKILAVRGVSGVHELHVWQLSESKVVASVHVTVSRTVDFMDAAAQIRRGLHHLGIHSSTIQPEYHGRNSSDMLKTNQDTSCLIPCPPDLACAADNACCPPGSTDV